MKKLSLRKKLYLLIAIVIIPMLGFEIVKLICGFNKSIHQEYKNNQDYAEALQVSFTNFIDRVWDTELAIGITMANDKNLSYTDLGKYMREIEEKQPSVKQYSIVDMSYNIISSSNPNALGVSLIGRDYVDRILSGEEKVISNMTVSRVDGKPAFIIARAIKRNGKLIGIVSANIDVTRLEEVLPPARSKASDSHGLVDANGVIVYRSGIPDVASSMTKLDETSPTSEALKSNAVKASKYKSPIDNEDYLSVNTPIKEIGWVSYANSSYKEVQAKTTKETVREIAALTITALLCILLAVTISNRIVKSILVLQRSAQEVSKGNLKVRTNIKGNDEIAAVGQAFDQMAVSIEEYDKLKTQFVSTVSHELKTPLNIILASIQMLNTVKEMEEVYKYNCNAEKYIHMMKQNCFRLLRLINNLIDISRLDAGFLKINPENNNIVYVVEEITLSVISYAKSKGIEIIFDTEEEEIIMAFDADKIERILLNLLSNAIKFTEIQGFINVNISKNDSNVFISVKDTGIGIPEDKLSIIFERFRQVDSTLQREHEGSGIGLSLVKALVEAHGGTIVVTSEIGKGSEFVIKIPIKVLEQNGKPGGEYTNQNVDRIQKINIEFSDIYS